MSKPILSEDGKSVKSRNGEFYEVSSCYRTPGLVDQEDNWDEGFNLIQKDIDELMNKPRRFFDTLLGIVETNKDIAKHPELRDELVRGCEMWLSAVENGLYASVIELSVPLDERGKELKKEYEADL